MRRRHVGDRAHFERLVASALDRLPESIRSHMENLEIVIADRPSREELAEAGLGRNETLLGLYQGIPLTERASSYNMVLPDRITLFRVPILEGCRTDADVIEEVRRTVLHEVGHFFGMDEEDLEQLGYE